MDYHINISLKVIVLRLYQISSLLPAHTLIFIQNFACLYNWYVYVYICSQIRYLDISIPSRKWLEIRVWKDLYVVIVHPCVCRINPRIYRGTQNSGPGADDYMNLAPPCISSSEFKFSAYHSTEKPH